MKRLFICIIMMLCLGVNSSNSQNVERKGKTFKQINKGRTMYKADTLVTAFIFEDSKSNKYPIIVNKGSGSCYVWKKSGKTGKLYKMYMKPEISQAVCKELKIQYKPRNKK